MVNRIETVIVGGGQAGLALSYWLGQFGREHIILERARLAERWRSELVGLSISELAAETSRLRLLHTRSQWVCLTGRGCAIGNRPAQGSVGRWIISSATSRPRQSSG
jgi:cation diffusion facilitator CzcD-associated flavoprotein CzcO